MPINNQKIFVTSGIDAYPAADSLHPVDSANQITLGGLHASVLKLVNSLIRQHLITMSEEDYRYLVNLYTYLEDRSSGSESENVLSGEDLDRFEAIVKRMVVHPEAVRVLRIIGGEFCDSGPHDFLTLLVLNKLHAAGVKLEILFSKHVDFLLAHERKAEYLPSHMRAEDAGSMIALEHSIKGQQVATAPAAELRALVEGGARLQAGVAASIISPPKGQIIALSEVNKFVEKVYKKSLRALSYSLSEDRKTITIYSYAAIDLQIIKTVAQRLRVEYRDKDAAQLAWTLEKINEAFAHYVQEAKVHRLYRADRLVGLKPKNVFAFLATKQESENLLSPTPTWISWVNASKNRSPGDRVFHLGHFNLAGRPPINGVSQQSKPYPIFYSQETVLAADELRVLSLGASLEKTILTCRNGELKSGASVVLSALSLTNLQLKKLPKIMACQALYLTRQLLEARVPSKNLLAQYSQLINKVEEHARVAEALLAALTAFFILVSASFLVMALASSGVLTLPLGIVIAGGAFTQGLSIAGVVLSSVAALLLGSAAKDYAAHYERVRMPVNAFEGFFRKVKAQNEVEEDLHLESNRHVPAMCR